MAQLIYLKPFFLKKKWGGDAWRNWKFPIKSTDQIGEIWSISSMQNCESKVLDGHKQIIDDSLQHFYQVNKKAFGLKDKKYPLLAKIISPYQDLNIQVHPDDQYAKLHENSLGKVKCWYVLKAQVNAQIIYGHHAKTSQELKQFVDNKNWKDLFKKANVKTGDFVFIPTGKIHALIREIQVYELQQASNVTYCFYDYDIKDANGNLRELHTRKCLDVTTVPDKNYPIFNMENGILTENEFFTMIIITCQKQMILKYENTKFYQITVVEGHGEIFFHKVAKGNSIIIYNIEDTDKITIHGKLKLILSFKKTS